MVRKYKVDYWYTIQSRDGEIEPDGTDPWWMDDD